MDGGWSQLATPQARCIRITYHSLVLLADRLAGQQVGGKKTREEAWMSIHGSYPNGPET